jgi:hypothetical protein
LVLILVVVGVIGWLRPHDDNETASTPVSGHSSSKASPSSDPTASPKTSHSSSKPSKSASKSPSTKPSTKPSSKPSSKPSTSKSASPTPTPTHSSAKPPPDVPRDYPVVVLNETPIHGLAAKVADRLRDKGWTVTGVGNWIGAIHETTVYYPSGERSRAERLAADLGVNRIRPRVGGMLPNRLSVVLHDPPD